MTPCPHNTPLYVRCLLCEKAKREEEVHLMLKESFDRLSHALEKLEAHLWRFNP